MTNRLSVRIAQPQQYSMCDLVRGCRPPTQNLFRHCNDPHDTTYDTRLWFFILQMLFSAFCITNNKITLQKKKKGSTLIRPYIQFERKYWTDITCSPFSILLKGHAFLSATAQVLHHHLVLQLSFKLHSHSLCNEVYCRLQHFACVSGVSVCSLSDQFIPCVSCAVVYQDYLADGHAK